MLRMPSVPGGRLPNPNLSSARDLRSEGGCRSFEESNTEIKQHASNSFREILWHMAESFIYNIPTLINRTMVYLFVLQMTDASIPSRPD